MKSYIAPLFLAALFLASNISADLGHRWVVPLLNVISVRILPSEKYLSEFEVRGMPVNEVLLEQKGIPFNDRYFSDPNLAQFREWLYSSGKNVYMRFLIRHPAHFFQTPLESWDLIFGFLPDTQGTVNDNLDFAPQNFRELIPYFFAEILYPKKFGLLFLFLSFIIVGVLIGRIRSWRGQQEIWLILALLVSSYPMILVTYHGDASGVSRHELSSLLQIILACWLFVLIHLDIFLSRLFPCRWNNNPISSS